MGAFEHTLVYLIYNIRVVALLLFDVAVAIVSDVDGDGYISFEEMLSYLTSVFKVMDALEPQSFSQAGLLPDELAASTAAQCFADVDIDEDGQLRYNYLCCFVLCCVAAWYAH